MREKGGTTVLSEKWLERKLKEKAGELGLKCLKFRSPSNNGVPDRVIMHGHGLVSFVEVKTTGEKPSPLQLEIHREFREMGYQVFVVDDLKSLESYIKWLKSVI